MVELVEAIAVAGLCNRLGEGVGCAPLRVGSGLRPGETVVADLPTDCGCGKGLRVGDVWVGSRGEVGEGYGLPVGEKWFVVGGILIGCGGRPFGDVPGKVFC